MPHDLQIILRDLLHSSTLYIFLGAVTIKYWLGPILVLKSMVLAANRKWQQVWMEELPAEVFETFNAVTPDLVQCGFRALVHVRASNVATRVQETYVSLWVNESAGDAAVVAAVRARRPNGTFRAKAFLTFRHAFEDAFRITTSNTPAAKIAPEYPRLDATVCRGWWNVRGLYQFHRARVARAGHGAAAPLPNDQTALKYFHDDYFHDLRRHAEAGYYWYDQAVDGYRPTLKGAFNQTWRTLFPWKQIGFAQRDRKADRELRELGFPSLQSIRTDKG